jgi:predicted HTH transcriptional regulator
MFFKLDLIQSYGSGIRRAKTAMEVNGSPKLVFSPNNDTDDYTLAVAYVNEEFARIQEESDKSVSDIGIENGIENGIESKAPATAEFIKTYSQSRRKTAVKIALEILANSMLTIPQISDNSGVSKRTVARYMKEFQDAGVLIREGSDTNGKWILV